MPAASGGDTAVICESETTLNDTAGMVPKLTAVAPVKWLPLMVTLVPPAVLPLDVPSDEIDGDEARGTVNWSPLLAADVPAVVVRVTSTCRPSGADSQR